MKSREERGKREESTVNARYIEIQREREREREDEEKR